MKRSLLAAIVIAIVLSGCKYKEGPMISFRSVYKRITGAWEIIEFTSNGVDSLKYFKDSCSSIVVIQNIDKETSDKEYYMFFNFMKLNEFDTPLKFNEKKKEIYIDFGDKLNTILGPIGKGNSNWKILKLTNKDFKISTTFNHLVYIILFKKTKL